MDVRESFWRSALETVRFLTGKRVTWAELYKWKSKPGNNDDWSMVSNWATALGRPTTYEQARDAFERCRAALREVHRVEQAIMADGRHSQTSVLVNQLATMLSELALGPKGEPIDLAKFLAVKAPAR